MFSSRILILAVPAALSLATASVQGAEPTEDMRMMAGMFASLEARDLTGYCAAKHAAPYASYLSRVCQVAVQNRLKQSEDCTPERIAQQAKTDAAQCLAMPAPDFEQTVLRGREASKAFVKELAVQGVDGEQLLQQARDKRR